MAVASLILGIVAIVGGISTVGSGYGLIAGIIGVILGALARKSNPTGMATAGLVCSIIGLVLSAIIFVACASCAGAISSLA